MTLLTFLEQKPLFYANIDYARFPKIYQRLAPFFQLPKIIHIVGTNGKGTTGRFLAQMLRAQKLHVGHYTSPHILRFNERIWIDDAEVTDKALEKGHQWLFSHLNDTEKKELSYFEYTTLLAMHLFSQTCDYVVLEAGLGGEFDATNVFSKILSVITPIGYDHEAFLGNTIEAIATTKLNSIQTDFILAKQPYEAVTALAHAMAKQKKVKCIESWNFLSRQRLEQINAYSLKQGYPNFLRENFITAYSALTFLGYDMDVETLSLPVLSGRFQQFLPSVTLDVGHNPLAAEAILRALGTKKVVFIYNSYADKEYEKILTLLKPVIKRLEIIAIDSPRAVKVSDLEAVAQKLKIPILEYKGIKPEEEYIVFGSFSVVEAFLRGYREK